MEKVKYTVQQIRFILDNYIKNKNLWDKETVHSLGSIKLTLQNICATFIFLNFSKVNPTYSRIADEYREVNQVHVEAMSKKSFCVRFGIING